MFQDAKIRVHDLQESGLLLFCRFMRASNAILFSYGIVKITFNALTTGNTVRLNYHPKKLKASAIMLQIHLSWVQRKA